MLKTIFCCNVRCLKFYLNNDREPENLKTSICKPYEKTDLELQKLRNEDLDFDDIRDIISKKRDLTYGLLHEFVDHFHHHGGFEAVRNALKSIINAENTHSLPLSVIPDLTSPFRNLGTILDEKYAKEMTEEVQELLLKRLNDMSEEEMKDVEKSTINDLLVEIREFLIIAIDENIVDEKLESIKLSMALRFLKSASIKKRLNGINEIKSIIEMTTMNLRRGWHDEDSPRRARWLTPEYLCKWIHDCKLTDMLLGEDSHIEVIKRSASVLKFLSYNKQLTKDHLDLLWKCQDGKHEATVLGVFETIIDISLDLNLEALNYIFEKIDSIPTKKYNEQVLNFVKDFTINA
jgi:hypothetical protein